MRIIAFSLILVSTMINNCSNGQVTNNYLANDIRLFKHINWELAQAVSIEDTVQIKNILKDGNINVDEREPKFGMTLLIWAINEKKYHSAEVLLKNHADPNLHDNYDGTSAIIAAADNSETSKFLELVLMYGADPNNEIQSDTSLLNQTPLVVAARNNIDNVKVLINAGAEINKGADKGQSALFTAVRFEQVDVVKYLLIEKNAEFRFPVYETLDGKKLYIVDYLRDWIYPLDSDKYQKKMEIAKYLKDNGMDYWKTKIPKRYYNQYSSEFLEKY